MFFRKKKYTYILTKIYFFVNLKSYVDFEWLRINLLVHCNGEPVEYSMNYGVDRKISTLPSLAGTIAFGDLEAFDCSDEFGKVIFSLGRGGNAFGDTGGRALFECFVISDENISFNREVEILRKFACVFDLKFGYVRRLSSDFSPASETKIKTGIFGQSSKIGRIQDAWLFDPRGINSGAIKGIYSVNFWRRGALDNLKKSGFNISKPIPTEEGIFQFEQEELREMARDNPNFEKFIHFN